MRLCPKCGKRCEDARCPDDGTATLVFAANPDSRLQLGTEVNGRYRIHEMIGQGGFGAVYKATNIATDQDIAIKLLAVSLDNDDSDMIQRFFAEAQITASLKHPNTIRVFDFGQTEGGALYIAMELLGGQPLNELLRRRGHEGRVLTEEETINIGSQSLRSLAEAHLANLVHRDLKPHNIFLHEVEGDDTVVKVLDFGIAKKLGSNLTGTGKAFGTPTYMSPEQAQNKPIDRRSDLYSLGCVLFQCVAGRAPFEGDNPLAVLLSHVTEPPPDLRVIARTSVSESFVRVIERALAKDPNDRFANAIEMRQGLEACRGADRTENMRSPNPASLLMASAQQDGPEEKTTAYDAPAHGGEERTAAYATPLAPGAGRAATPGGAAGTPQVAVTIQSPVENPTFGFFSKTPDSAVITSEAASPGEAEVLPPRRRKTVVFLGIAAVALVAGVGAMLMGGRPDPQPLDTAVQTPPVVAKVEPTPATPAPAPANVFVELASTPAGAAVQVDGKVLGNAPVRLQIVGSAKVTARLTLAGHNELEVQVGRDDGPIKTVQLSAKTGPAAQGGTPTPVVADQPAKKAAKTARARSASQGKATQDKAKTKSALEERL